MHDHDPNLATTRSPAFGVNLDSVESVSIAVLVHRLGRLAYTQMREIWGAP